jgi:hypothetical protein
MLAVRRLLLTLLLALLVFPATAGASMEFALQDDDVFVHQRGYDRDRALDHAVELGATRIRVNVLWARVLVSGGSAHPVYDFSAIDALQEAAADRGIELQLTIAGPAPSWATRDHRVGNVAPDPVKFGAFARTVAQHFAGRVDRYSIWNEPNWSTWLAPAKQAASLYRKLYRSGYAAVKGVDPRAQVLIGELAPVGGGHAIAPLKFLRDLTPRGSAPLKADGFALHPYQLTSAPAVATGKPDDVTIGTLSRLTSALDALARRNALTTPKGRRLDLYLTEFGYLTVGSRAQKASVRATWLSSAIRIARRNPRVRQLLQYQLVDPPAAALWHSAILTRRGLKQPAYAALAKALNP